MKTYPSFPETLARRRHAAIVAAGLLLAPAVTRADSRVDSIPVDTGTGSLAAAAVDSASWSSAPAGWSFAQAYRSGTNDYLLLVRRHTGEIEVRDLGAGTIGSVSASYHLHRRFTGADIVMIGATPYLYLHDAATGHMRRYILESDGSLVASQETTNTALRDRELFATFNVGADSRVFAYDRWTGQYVVYTTNGWVVASGTWTRGWTSVDFVTIGNATYRMLYKASDEPGTQGGRLQITRIDASFDTLSTVHDGYHSDDWSTVKFLTTPAFGGLSFVAFYNAATGEYATRSFGGQLGNVFADETIDPGSTDIAFLPIGNTTYAMKLSEPGVTPLGTNQIANFAASARAALTTCNSTNCVAGYQLVLAENGKVVFKESGGVRNADEQTPVVDGTTFALGSVTKVITSTTAMRLVDWGEIDMDGPLVNYLDYDDVYDYDDFDPTVRYITVRDALEHTTGLDDTLGSCDVPDENSANDCTAYLSNPRSVSCSPNAAIADPNALTCTRKYENENTSLVRSLIERDMDTQGMQPIVDVTRALWMDDTNISGRTCEVTEETDSDLHDGVSLNVIPSSTNVGCANGGWKLSALDVLEVARALRYEWLFGPELTADLLTDTSGSGLVWDSNGFVNVATITRLAYKNGATTGVQNQFGMEGAGTNRQVDVVLLTNTTGSTGVSARNVLDNAFAAMGTP